MRIFLAIAILCASTTARADLASSVYGDVRDVVEELIQTEVTHSVVTAIERRSPALAFYLHGTLERLGSPYWGSLGRALKDDLTLAVADFVYWHLSTGGGDGDVVGSAKRFFGCVAAVGQARQDAGCTRLRAAVEAQRRPLLEVECRRQKPAPERRVACDIGLAVRAALERRAEAKHHLVDALADIVLAHVDDGGLANRLRDVLTKWLDLPKDLPTPLLEALGNADLGAALEDGAIDTLCGDPKMIENLLRDPSSTRGWICFAVTHPALPKALGADIQIVDGKRTVTAHLDFWVIEAALKDFDADRATDDTSFRLLADAAFDENCPAGTASVEWPCKGARYAPSATVAVTWLGRQSTGTVGKTGALEGKMLSTLLRFRKLIRRIEELRALVPGALQPYLFYAGSTPPQAKLLLRAAHRMARLVTELRGRWYLWAADAKTLEDLDVAELLHVARDTFGGETDGPLAFLDKHAAGGASSIDIGDWLRLVMRADYRALAMEALRAALDLSLNDASRPKETFFLTLAAYLLDTGGDGAGENIARSAFRAAAKDLLLSASHRGVPRAADRFRFRLLPRLALALSFNDTYATTDGDSRRSVVAAYWPTMMLAVTDYWGLEASFVDPVAPLAEMALRPVGAYHGYPYVALDALRPRLGAWLAVPSLSNRLALTAGFGVRFLDVTTTMTDGKLDAHYGAKASLVFDAGFEFVF